MSDETLLAKGLIPVSLATRKAKTMNDDDEMPNYVVGTCDYRNAEQVRCGRDVYVNDEGNGADFTFCDAHVQRGVLRS